MVIVETWVSVLLKINSITLHKITKDLTKIKVAVSRDLDRLVSLVIWKTNHYTRTRSRVDLEVSSLLEVDSKTLTS